MFGVASLAIAGCYDNVATVFPPGTEPWQDPNVAMLPAAVGSDACPETLVQVDVMDYMGGHVHAVHAAACVHAPLVDVFGAMQDPEVGHDPPSTNTFMVLPMPIAEECDGQFQTQINAGAEPSSVDFRLCWRFAVVTGTETAPELVAARWQKVWGTAAIGVLEGSLVAEPFDGDPSITAVHYQYHLNAASVGESNYTTIHNYLDHIYSRLVRRSHGEVLPTDSL